MLDNYTSLKQRHGEQALALMPESMRRVDWDRDRVEAYQTSLLRELLVHVKAHSPWYAEARLADIDPERATVADLAAIAPTTKKDLNDNFDQILTDRRLDLATCEAHLEREVAGGAYLLDEYRVSVSGGMSGTRVIGVFGWDELSHNWNAFMRLVMRWIRRTRAIAGPPKLATVTASSNIHGSQQLAGIFGAPDTVRLTVTDPMSEIVDTLNASPPDAMVVYPSILPALARETERGCLKIVPKVIMCGAEPLLPEHEEAATRAWEAKTLSIWGATEVGMIAAGTGFESGMLLFDDHAIVEPVDEQGAPVAPGQRAAKVYVTPLRRRVLPAIRYELTDQLVPFAEPACCGSSFRRVSNVEGRLDDSFTYGDTVVNAHLFRSVLSQEKSLLSYQVEQTANGAHVRVVAAGEIDGPALCQALSHGLRRLGVGGAAVTIEKVDCIARDAQSTKLRRFIPLEGMDIA